ncbi:hypothetical protein PAXRUDRAFT_821523 [Paxillus rubicundulus Ve08.2h10]|uniref:Uncharacterized protein n=1 Tax=Paxillus rubicundulus Ve08.2h10 TaxID=930991 RepID=A0A0D0EAS5_9AGAM|nr:hypothetical protein PAXRUDRAFT_821523 [Paxillus rubicundulus Ve08.2h10]
MPSTQSLRENTRTLLLTGLAVGLLLLLRWPTSLSSWILLTCWPLGLVTFLLIARAYLAPYVLTRFSSHIRVRSVSLRSIRGLYFRKGNRTWQIDRFGYSYSASTDDKPKGLSFKVEGFKLEIQPIPVPRPPPPRAKHRRGLTLADLSPSPLALYLWSIVSSLYSIFDPLIRPAVRLVVTAILQQVIRFIPRLTETVQLEIDRAIVSFNATPQAQLVVENVVLKGHVSFTQNSQSRPAGDLDLHPGNQTLTARALAMGAWKPRLAKGFKRTWTRTWDHTLGQTTGSVAYDLVVQEVRGFIPALGLAPAGMTRGETFLRSPEPFSVSGSARFSPRDGTIEPGSVHSRVRVGLVYVDLDSLQTWLSHLQAPTENVPAPPPNSSLSTATSPWLKSPFGASSTISDVHVQTKKHRRWAMKPLEVVATVRFSLGSLTVSKRVGRHKYSVVLQDVSCHCEPSNATTNPIHRAWLGRQSSTSSPQAYSLCLTFQGISLQRPNDMAQCSSRILFIDSTSVHTVISNWPSLMPTSPSLALDSYLPSVLLDIKVASVSLTDRLDVLLHLISELGSSKEVPRGESEPLLPSILSPVPQIVADVRVGRLFTRIACVDMSAVEEPFSIELETEGMFFTSSSSFRTGPAAVAPRAPHRPPYESFPLRMTVSFRWVLHPLFLRLRSSAEIPVTRRMSRWGAESLNNETLFSMEAVEASGALTALGEVNGDDQLACATLRTRSIFVDLHCRTEAVLVELWQPKRFRVLSVLLSLLAAHPRSSGNSHISSMLPVGYALSFSVARFVLFLTGSDINPDVDKDITRGVAFSTGVSVRYCSVGAEQLDSFSFPQSQSQNRAKLYLPVDRLCDTAIWTELSRTSGENVAVAKLMLWNTTVRSAAADEFSMDDPHITERDSPFLDAKQLVGIKNIDADIKFTSQTLSNFSRTTCDVTFSIDDSLLSFELDRVYSALLALRTMQTLWQCAAPPGVTVSQPSPSPSLTLAVHGTVKAVRMRFRLLDQNVVARVNYFDLSSTPHDSRCSINSLLVWVPVLVQRTPSNKLAEENWEELGRLHRCTLSFAAALKGSIMVDSDSVRIRIPSGYVFAELQLAAVVTIKAFKHMFHMAATGKFMPMVAPEARAVNVVPDLTFTCRMLSLEAADDLFESHLGFNYRIGVAAAKARLHREEAFDAKASAIMAGHSTTVAAPAVHTDYQFGGQHSTSIQDARQRLDLAHALDWILRHKQQRSERVAQEDLLYRELHGTTPLKRPTKAPDLVKAVKPLRCPPLLRIIFSDFRLRLQRPTFPPEQLSTFLHDQGNGLLCETLYSLLVPMHLNICLGSLQVTLRDYPLPLLYIPPRARDSCSPSLLFDSNLVIAEEMGPPQSVEWIPCPIVGLEEGYSTPFLIQVPKTIMPVKTYARPLVSVLADQTTAFSWGVSYSPAIQDVVRVLESLTPETRDSSPHIGFWDKLRLIFHWTIKVSFQEEVRLYIKGNRDPYVLDNDGAGFALCWQGEPQINIGFQNEDREIVQVTSDTMSIIIPKFEFPPHRGGIHAQGHLVARNDCVKICAKLSSGVRFGVGTVFERTCGVECNKCTGSSFDRGCRFFHFRSHHSVQLVKTETSKDQINRDSYRGFRSDFIHLSISLTSAVRQDSPDFVPRPSSFHLTPKAFSNFWSWWGLFDNGLLLPIRQGSLYTHKTLSPKFSRHLATIKYRISVPHLFITHAYIDDTRESWEDGTTSIVGLKAKVNHFQADMHQRDQETIAPDKDPDSIQVVRHKPFYAAEVVFKDVDLRAMLAAFPEPLKQTVLPPTDVGNGSKNKSSLAPEIPPSWLDKDDFVETDWCPSQHLPEIQLFPVLSCPKLTYIKKNPSGAEIHAQNSKFGDEDTHTCLLGSEPSVPQVEIFLAEQRIATLQQMAEEDLKLIQCVQRQYPLEKMVILLQHYIKHLEAVDQHPGGARKSNVESYYMPAEMVSADEWADFENVYQVHSPNLFMCNAVRDVLMQYYNCSRARRGYEYHLATRAVKFIRDQAEAMASQIISECAEKSKVSGGAAQAAASALRKMLTRERDSASLDIQSDVTSDPANVDPLDGWEEGVVLRKRHFCLLLKPQIILRSADPSSDAGVESFVILAAVQAKLQVFKIMDASNLEDPISGSIMNRNYMSLDGLQTFCPTDADSYGNGSVPLEVLLDYRCESDAFDRIVPQTNANCRYDQFNQLRLRNNVASSLHSEPKHPRRGKQAHLHNETDLVQIHVPRFTVSANDRHFQFISIIITHLILFSDVAHKARLEKLEMLLFAYDFTDLRSAATVVSDLQTRIRSAIEAHDDVSRQVRDNRSQRKLETLRLRAHILQLVEELSLIFDAIKLAQSRVDDRTDQKSALLLQASSSEISWMMLDDNRDLLAKLAVCNIDFSWLSKQDSSTVNRLTVGHLLAYDGSPHAVWTEIVSKFEEPSNHPLFKRELFLEADWTILAPVGGITIYEKFQLDFHPIRLQLDARLGRRIMEYVWPARRGRNQAKTQNGPHQPPETQILSEQIHPRSSLDSSRLQQKPRTSLDSNRLVPGLRKLGASRSFTDLRSAAAESTRTPSVIVPQPSQQVVTLDSNTNEDPRAVRKANPEDRPGRDDAVEMKTRSHQKTFILVKISSIELLLSIIKAESFECRDARIRTHSLEFRNQTWSFEELVDQFIPSDLTWKGWVRMAFHQPLVPVLPVARELFSKTKLIASKNAAQADPRPPLNKKFTLRGKKTATDTTIREKRPRRLSSSSGPSVPTPSNNLTGIVLTDEPEASMQDHDNPEHDDSRKNCHHRRPRLLSVFNRGKSETRSLRLPLPSAEHRSSEDSLGHNSLDLA